MNKMKQCTRRKMSTKVFEFGRVDAGPGPAAYATKTTIGQANRMPTVSNPPAYSIKRRLDKAKPEYISPGPVYNVPKFTRQGVDWAPKFSMGIHLPEKVDMESPGPGVYKPNNGQKPRLKILLPLKDVDPRADNPGPDVYKLPTTLSGARFTLGKKIDFKLDVQCSPGPAMHETVPLNKYKQKLPQFSLAKKFDNQLDVADPTPGPPAYKATPTAKYKHKSMPKFSFGIRRPDKFPPLVVCGDEVIRIK